MNTKNLLSIFNLRKVEINIYESLLRNGPMNATTIAKDIRVSRTSIYDLIEKLLKTGLITETQKSNIKLFGIVPPEKIRLLIAEKSSELEKAKSSLVDLENIFYTNKKLTKPRLQIFDGETELQQMMKDILLYRDITVYAFWSIEKMIKILTPEFLKEFHKKRVERNIKIKVIYPKTKMVDTKKYPFLKIDPDKKRIARIAPPEIDFSLSYAIYNDKVRFISSEKEKFGFLVESPEMTRMMRTQFEFIWKKSKIIKQKKS